MELGKAGNTSEICVFDPTVQIPRGYVIEEAASPPLLRLFRPPFWIKIRVDNFLA
jgi:hypothetical protein